MFTSVIKHNTSNKRPVDNHTCSFVHKRISSVYGDNNAIGITERLTLALAKTRLRRCKLSLEVRMCGGAGSMSAMVREAIDEYIAEVGAEQ